ncbi:ROK family protein [Paenibacillus sp. LMG 31456]|uniref:ROK family protein n=1 Tax=Paenibacillus foliorum TaxID=2654974 RepID=A0A972GYF2_9BACL|nr:ROK family protein [Paenibacillus foliorum]NOU96092.1 ROK family protein [Paenibacillus foliorum]
MIKKIKDERTIVSNKMIYLQQVKQNNMSEVLGRIWQYRQASRVELVERTGLTSGTLTNLTHELIEMNVLRENESISGNVGRRRVMLGFDPRVYRIIGLDIGRTALEIVVMDLNGEILQSIERDMSGCKGPEEYFRIITPIVNEVKKGLEAEGCKILGLGAGIPGPIDYDQGTLLAPPNFPGWEGYPVQRVLEEQCGLVTLIDDDARTSAMAERWYGLGKSSQNLVFVTMGVGIGGGVVSGGAIVRGANGLSGQVGHMTIVQDGKMCDCGNRGCWETVGSIPGILSRWAQGGTIEEFQAAIKRREPEALQCLDKTISYMETALVNIQNLYDPEVIVLGGRLYPLLSDSMDSLKPRFQSRLYAFAKDRLRIESSTFGTSQGAVGAAALLLNFLLSEPVRLLSLTEG